MWIVLAGLSGMAFAGYMLVNQHYRLDARALLLWRYFGVAAVMGLFLPFATLPQPGFWLLIVPLSMIFSIGDRYLFRSAATFGAGVTSRVLPTSVFISFGGWFLLHPEALDPLLAEPWSLIGVAAALSGLVLGGVFLRRDAVSREAMIALAPMVLVAGTVDLLNKSTMAETSGLVSGVLWYGAVGSGLGGVWQLLAIVLLDRRFDWSTVAAPRMVQAGWLIVLVTVALMSTRCAAMLLTPNPGYVAGLMLTASLWVMVYNRLRGVPDSSPVLPGLGIVAAAAVLILSVL